MTGERKCHPACLLLPELGEQEYRELVDDMRNQGQRHPIIVDGDGVILDGRHRYRACQELFVEPMVETFHGTEAEKIALVMSENIIRRHLTTAQRAAIAAELSENWQPQPATGCSPAPQRQLTLGVRRPSRPRKWSAACPLDRSSAPRRSCGATPERTPWPRPAPASPGGPETPSRSRPRAPRRGSRPSGRRMSTGSRLSASPCSKRAGLVTAKRQCGRQ